MFFNNSKKIKILAEILLVVGLVISVCIGIGVSILIDWITDMTMDGCFAIGIPLGVLLSSPFTLALARMIYGFAEIIENTAESAKYAKMQFEIMSAQACKSRAGNNTEFPNTNAAPKASKESELLRMKREKEGLVLVRQYQNLGVGIAGLAIGGIIVVLGLIYSSFALITLSSVFLALGGIYLQKKPSEMEVQQNIYRAIELGKQIEALEYEIKKEKESAVDNP